MYTTVLKRGALPDVIRTDETKEAQSRRVRSLVELHGIRSADKVVHGGNGLVTIDATEYYTD